MQYNNQLHLKLPDLTRKQSICGFSLPPFFTALNTKRHFFTVQSTRYTSRANSFCHYTMKSKLVSFDR